MKYMGSKNKHAREMLDIMLKELDTNYWVNVQYENWIEPFVGGANWKWAAFASCNPFALIESRVGTEPLNCLPWIAANISSSRSGGL